MSTTDLTLAELQALPVGSVVEDRDGDQFVRGTPISRSPSHVWLGTGTAQGGAWTATDVRSFRPVKIVSTP